MDKPLEQGVFADLARIEEVIAEDNSGDRAREIIDYFGQMGQASEALLQTVLPDAERQLTGQLVEGLRAAQRIVRQVWEATHTASLAL
jgi:hypothetical protein